MNCALACTAAAPRDKAVDVVRRFRVDQTGQHVIEFQSKLVGPRS